MPITHRATLSATVIVDEIEVEVDYTFDGEDLTIKSFRALTENPYAIDSYDFDEALCDAVSEVADEAYAEWLADLGDWQYEAAQDRKLDAMA